ncbi:class I SAM-dependent methyltransferase [Brevibacterium otitidis]|uniref:Class I SAM-dependent methyltransferase n=1 Tax=Brevibacterium otitidis TaxID=53364 RepID=A0ABV5X1A9_9MICO|nr:hypothetical protein GCM10023233_29060 [Brevibacterium otitidis]
MDRDLRAKWNERWADHDSDVDGTDPNPEVEEAIAGLFPDASARPGSEERGNALSTLRAVDLGSGAGRNTAPLARAGLQTTAVDFSPVAIARLCARAAAEGWDERLIGITADLVTWMQTTAERYDLVVAGYIHGLDGALSQAARLLEPGGRLLWILHAPESPHGPPPHIHRPSAEEVFAGAAGIDVLTDVRADTVVRDERFTDIVLTATRRA